MRWLGVWLLLLVSGCATVPDRAARGLLRLEVRPVEAQIHINEEYRGRVNQWHQGTLVLGAGRHRVQIVAKGYLSQRFDIEIGADEEVVLRVLMEPEFETFSEP